MIVVYHKQGIISIAGHANYAPIGQDIVCAAVSALVQTCVASVEELTTDEIKVTKDEQGQIQAIQYKHLSERAQVLLDAFFVGIRMIADAYPSNVKLAQAWMA